ncbi:hypothetical protein Tco_0962759 [Tanacetum coccineum]
MVMRLWRVVVLGVGDGGSWCSGDELEVAAVVASGWWRWRRDEDPSGETISQSGISNKWGGELAGKKGEKLCDRRRMIAYTVASSDGIRLIAQVCNKSVVPTTQLVIAEIVATARSNKLKN